MANDKEGGKKTGAEDVKMTDAAKPGTTDEVVIKKDELKEKKKDPRIAVYDRFRDQINALQAGADAKDYSQIYRVVRYINTLRKRFSSALLNAILNEFYPSGSATKDRLLGYLAGVPDDVEMKAAPSAAPTPSPTAASGTTTPAPAPEPLGPVTYEQGPTRTVISPEVSMYLELMVTLYLIDHKRFKEALEATTVLFDSIPVVNRRTIDPLSARVYFYFTYLHEKQNDLLSILPSLLEAQRTACLHHDEPSQTTLTNCILRTYLHYNLYPQAEKFHLNINLPDSKSNHDTARFKYYQGRIHAVQLNYTAALEALTQAIRKAPPKTAVGFRLEVTKLLVIVQLLMGDIPERSLFRQADLKRSLVPYLQLTQAVRIGNLDAFKAAMETHKDTFVKDKNYLLIIRLRQNVIKTGLRKINLSYSRISIADICARLHLDNVDDAEYIIAKAISDGVIDAVIDHTNKSLYSKENLDVYSTQEPQQAFQKRTRTCFLINNEAVTSLRFPPDAHKPQTEKVPLEEDDEEMISELAEDVD